MLSAVGTWNTIGHLPKGFYLIGGSSKWRVLRAPTVCFPLFVSHPNP